MKSKAFKVLALLLTTCLLLTCREEIADYEPVIPETPVELSGRLILIGPELSTSARTGDTWQAIQREFTAHAARTVRDLPQLNLMIVEAADAKFASAMRSTGLTVIPDIILKWYDPIVPVDQEVAVNLYGNPPSSLDDDFYFDLQYGHDDINAPEAWNAGFRGAGVQVAVLDGGFDLDHPDLEPNINFGLSMNFVAGESLWFALPGFSHGSHVAGTIAGADNGFGIIGVAPEAELVLVKVLSDAGGGSFADVVTGIVYAADVGVDVISMSLGAYIPGFGVKGVSPQDILGLVKLMDNAILYAYNKGATVIASAGNGAVELSRSGLIHLPSDASKAVSISATTAVGWATGMGERDVFTSYSSYGLPAIDLAAPGGDDQYTGSESCTIGSITVPCWVFDLIFSASSNLNPAFASYAWAAGTSMAVPHVSGVAALIIGKNGGSMNPGSVEAKLKASATDLGKPGRDAYFGFGRVDAYKAVTK